MPVDIFDTLGFQMHRVADVSTVWVSFHKQLFIILSNVEIVRERRCGCFVWLVAAKRSIFGVSGSTNPSCSDISACSMKIFVVFIRGFWCTVWSTMKSKTLLGFMQCMLKLKKKNNSNERLTLYHTAYWV